MSNTETKVEYKDTLNLPQTTLEMRANATVKEISTQKFWEENKILPKNSGKKIKFMKKILLKEIKQINSFSMTVLHI